MTLRRCSGRPETARPSDNRFKFSEFTCVIQARRDLLPTEVVKFRNNVRGRLARPK